MDIQLSPDAQRFIEAQLQLGKYRSVAEVIDALVEEKTASTSAVANLEALTAKQRQRLLDLVEECEALALAPPLDGLTNRDHDRILYGERS
jgi:Arc/MetJ-type ribon-helix-helix transcriptional regulator